MILPQKISHEESLHGHINQTSLISEDRLKQFNRALELRDTPALYSQDTNPDPTVAVKFFDPCGSYTWYATEWDGKDRCFGFVAGQELELGYFDLKELSQYKGPLGVGIEVDEHFIPKQLSEVRKQHELERCSGIPDQKLRESPHQEPGIDD